MIDTQMQIMTIIGFSEISMILHFLFFKTPLENAIST